MSHDVGHLVPGENYDTFRVVEAIRAAVSEYRFSVGPETEPWTRFTVLRGPLVCSRMREDFGFGTQYALETAVAEFAEWIRTHWEGVA